MTIVFVLNSFYAGRVDKLSLTGSNAVSSALSSKSIATKDLGQVAGVYQSDVTGGLSVIHSCLTY
jgi:hypothetical protein